MAVKHTHSGNWIGPFKFRETERERETLEFDGKLKYMQYLVQYDKNTVQFQVNGYKTAVLRCTLNTVQSSMAKLKWRFIHPNSASGVLHI